MCVQCLCPAPARASACAHPPARPTPAAVSTLTHHAQTPTPHLLPAPSHARCAYPLQVSAQRPLPVLLCVATTHFHLLPCTFLPGFRRTAAKALLDALPPGEKERRLAAARVELEASRARRSSGVSRLRDTSDMPAARVAQGIFAGECSSPAPPSPPHQHPAARQGRAVSGSAAVCTGEDSHAHTPLTPRAFTAPLLILFFTMTSRYVRQRAPQRRHVAPSWLPAMLRSYTPTRPTPRSPTRIHSFTTAGATDWSDDQAAAHGGQSRYAFAGASPQAASSRTKQRAH